MNVLLRTFSATAPCFLTTGFDLCVLLQNGFDYLLTYSDNPQTVFPRYCVNWMVSSGKLFFYSLKSGHVLIKFTCSCWVCISKEGLPLHLAGMPEFLEKLHNAALRAKNLEVGIHDYAGVIKSSDTNRQPSQERLGGENPHTAGSGQIYAWNQYFAHQVSYWCVVTCSWAPVETLQLTFFSASHELHKEVATCFSRYSMSIQRPGYSGCRWELNNA